MINENNNKLTLTTSVRKQLSYSTMRVKQNNSGYILTYRKKSGAMSLNFRTKYY